MLVNPFTPSEIAANPDLFWGRQKELQTAEAAIKKGSILIQGGVGIGKSSLLAQILLRAEGFNTSSKAITHLIVATREVASVDDLARLMLESFTEIDEQSNTFKIKLGPVAEYESKEVVKHFAQGRHLTALTRAFTTQHLRHLESDTIILIAIDEADKCPIAITRLIRSLATHMQQQHIRSFRFAIAGVNPYYKEMLDEDEGLQRFFYKKINLLPMPIEEADELFRAKMNDVLEDARKRKIPIRVHPETIGMAVALSGGHPHVLQLLGSHIIDHENMHNDGYIDKKDMVEALKIICYDDRGYVYDRLLHLLKSHGYDRILRRLFHSAGRSFPTRIPRDKAAEEPNEALVWFIDNNILIVCDDYEYGLVDEFLRVRMLLDNEGENPREMTNKILSLRGLRYVSDKQSHQTDSSFYHDIASDFAKQYSREKDPFEE